MIRFRSWLPPLLLAGLGIGLYGVTLAPTVTGTDAGELILAAYSGGVAHARGFPTWLLVAAPISHMPLGSPAWRLNALWAVAGALTLAVLWGWLRMLPLPAPARVRPPSRRQVRNPPPTTNLPDWLLPAAGVLAFAAGRSFWPWATSAEVYTLNALLVVLSLYLLFCWSSGTAPFLALPLAAFSFGLALGDHSITTALLAPAIALWLYWHRRHLTPGLFAASVAALLLGVAVYVVLPLRAASAPVLNWGDPDTLYRFWRQITAAQYRSNINLALPSIASQLGFGLRLSFWQFGPLGLPLILWGLVWGWQHQRKTTLFVLVGSLSVIAYAVLYAIADDQDTYYMLAHALLVAPLVWGVARLLAWTTTKIPGSQTRRALTAGLPLIIPLLALVSNFGAGNRAAYWYHDDYFHQLTAEAPAGGAIFTRDWQFYSPSLYFQYVLHDRPDLRIIDVELMRRDWYLTISTANTPN